MATKQHRTHWRKGRIGHGEAQEYSTNIVPGARERAAAKHASEVDEDKDSE